MNEMTYTRHSLISSLRETVVRVYCQLSGSLRSLNPQHFYKFYGYLCFHLLDLKIELQIDSEKNLIYLPI